MKPKREQAQPTPPALRYVGAGFALDDVPARDLSAAEAGQRDWQALIASGLYVVAPTTEEGATDEQQSGA